MDILTSSPIKISPQLQQLFQDEHEVKFAVDYFLETLKNDVPLLKAAFAENNWKKTFFLAEKLLGASLYYDMPHLQTILQEITTGAFRETLTKEMLDKLEQEAKLRVCFLDS